MRDWMDDGAPDVVRLSHRRLRARKEYRCQVCGGPILPGQVYIGEAGTVDGEFYYERSHDARGECAPDCFDFAQVDVD